MALDVLTLQRALYEISTTQRPVDAFDAASRIAAAYRAYASTAQSLGFPLALPGPGVATMDLALGTAFATRPGVPPVVAAGFATMLDLFWTGATFTAVPPGVAAPPTGGVVLQAALTVLLAIPNTAETWAASAAAALHAATLTVLVTFPQPSPPPIIAPVV